MVLKHSNSKKISQYTIKTRFNNKRALNRKKNHKIKDKVQKFRCKISQKTKKTSKYNKIALNMEQNNKIKVKLQMISHRSIKILVLKYQKIKNNKTRKK